MGKIKDLMIDKMNAEPRTGRTGIFRFGRCRVIVSIDNGKWHLSISVGNVLPSYKEMKAARYKFCPDEIYMAEIFPPKDEFVNLHPYTRHLWQIDIDSKNPNP